MTDVRALIGCTNVVSSSADIARKKTRASIGVSFVGGSIEKKNCLTVLETKDKKLKVKN